MAKPWHRYTSRSESTEHHAEFRRFLELGPRRKIADMATGDNELKRLYRLSAKYDWVDRAAAWDDHEFAESLAKRQEARERVRQRFVDRALEFADTVYHIARGELPGWQPSAGHKLPVVKPSVRLSAALKALELAGITPHKRVEHHHTDDRAAELAARDAVRTLGPETLTILRNALRGELGAPEGIVDTAAEPSPDQSADLH